jgi:hypothetical protein
MKFTLPLTRGIEGGVGAFRLPPLKTLPGLPNPPVPPFVCGFAAFC